MKARLPEGVQMKRGDMMKQIQAMQQQMEQTQAAVEETTFPATAGGGMVTAQVNGKKELLSVKIDPEAVDPDDVEMLEDLITAAVGEALNKASKEMEDKMGAITGGMSDVLVGAYEDQEKLVSALKRLAKPGDVLLFKGSHGMHMDVALEQFLHEDR